MRRRDVQDMFLGTGLGPRAYAIIGQGMISRIIESKPEELRVFLEEAAGVSKYKERRRETENRLKDTRENLTRVDDILRELNANLEQLERRPRSRSATASCRSDGTLKQHQLWLLKHRDAAREQERVQAGRGRRGAALEARIAELRHVEAELEAIRQAHYAASDELHAAQGALGEAALDVSRLEERIRYVAEGRQRAGAPRADWRPERGVAGAPGEARAERDGAPADRRRRRAGRAARRAGRRAVATACRPRGRAARRAGGERARSAAPSPRAAADPGAAAEMRGIEEQARQLRRGASGSPPRRRVWRARSTPADLDAAQRSGRGRGATMPPSRACRMAGARAGARRARRDAAGARQRRGARHAESGPSRRAEGAAGKGADRGQAEALARPARPRIGLPGLWTRVRIEPGWETALEAALRERLGSLEIGRLDTVRAFAADAPPAGWPSSHAVGADPGAHRTLPRLADLLHLGDAGLTALLGDWLEGVYTAVDRRRARRALQADARRSGHDGRGSRRQP